MAIHLIHGFNVGDGGKSTVRRLEPFLEGPVVAHDYGWTFLFSLRCRNARAIEEIVACLQPGDVLVGHSNAAWIIWQLAQDHADKLAGVVVINPALRRDTLWPESLRVMCIHNSTDWVVELGRWWSRLVSLGGLNFHGWGAAGRHGFTRGQPKVTNWDSHKGVITDPVSGHSGLFSPPAVRAWGALIGKLASAWKRLYRQSQ